ncbi:MAG: hypothetical protein JXX28_02145 [Deltaproteobacteria bacterium]|nr:hypothetical protein [Deltaproteobacteria bacterium]
MIAALPDRWQLARGQVLPALRTTSRPNGSLRAASAGRPLLTRPFAPFLHQLLVLDGERTRTYLKAEQLERWGVAPAAAWITAEGNLPPDTGLKLAGGLWHLATGDGYAASRLALPGWLRAFSERLGAPAVAAIPHARALWVGTAAQAPALLEQAQAAWEEAGEPLSPALYTADATGTVRPWLPPPAHPLSARARRAQLLLAGTEYAAWADEAEQRLAPLSLVVRQGLPLLVARWEPGSGALIPQVDAVLRAEELLPWAAVADRLERVEDAVVSIFRERAP